ncbi:MAG: hypothetical protein CVU18_17675 [Betaproteobacteria bacterium HGW-Betaproteobacteria-12]|nr:MAG: hypothetical protein CVU18_17675 [Betaproteobacteria bacterium HGW-Betaproteobacteria-12]
MNVIEGLLGIATLLLHWRIAICLGMSALGAYALVQLLPWLTGLQGVVIGVLGLIPGTIWQAGREANGKAAQLQITTPFVAGLMAFFVGVIWGGASSTSLSSTMSGALILLLALLAWHSYRVSRPASMGQRRAIGYGTITVVTYFLVIGINQYLL